MADESCNHGTVHAVDRVRTLLAELNPDTYNIGGEIFYSNAFKSKEWPRTAYALDRPDLEAVLALAETALAVRLMQRSVLALVDKAVHTPARVRAYVAGQGWQVCAGHDYPDVSEWTPTGGFPADGFIVKVLHGDDWTDYAQVVASLVMTMAEWSMVGELAVLTGIAAAEPKETDRADG